VRATCCPKSCGKKLHQKTASVIAAEKRKTTAAGKTKAFPKIDSKKQSEEAKASLTEQTCCMRAVENGLPGYMRLSWIRCSISTTNRRIEVKKRMDEEELVQIFETELAAQQQPLEVNAESSMK